MHRSLCFRPCFDHRSFDTIPPDRDPVLLVSGIGGSILHSKKNIFGFQTRVWVRILLAELEFRKAWCIYNPKTGYTESLDKDIEILVPDDDYGLYAIDILDPSFIVKCMHLKEVYHFHDMIDMLIKCGYKKGTTLFGYGYDFRQSNRIEKLMEGLKVKLEMAYKASGSRKINIISHSMGGILVSCFMSLHKDVFSKYVRKWICIACPFQGAPGLINDSLLTGLEFLEGFMSHFFVSRWTMHQLFISRSFNKIATICMSQCAEYLAHCLILYELVECPSIYEMLGNPKFNWERQPKIQVWRKHSKNGETSVDLESYGLTESIVLFEEALRNNKLNYDGKSIALPFNLDVHRWAAGTREVLGNAKLPNGVNFYNIYGTSFHTPFDVCYGSETSPIEDLSEICRSVPQYSYVDGDGSVPAESAKADGFGAAERVAVAGSHRKLLRDKTVFQHIKRWLEVVDDHNVVEHLKTSIVADVASNKPEYA